MPRIINGIDIGSSAIRIIVAEEKKDADGFNILAVAKKESHGIRKGYIVNFEEAVDSVRETIRIAEKLSGIKIKSSFIAIGGISLGSVRSKGMAMVSRADNEVTDNDVKRAIDQSENNLSNLTNRKIIYQKSIAYKLDGSFVFGHPIGMKGTKLEVETIFITCLIQHFSDFTKIAESAGIAIDDVMPSSLAASYIVLSEKQKEAGCILVNVGASTVSVTVFEENLPISLEVFPIGSTHITNDIALGLQIPIEEAEKLKIEYGTESSMKRKIENIVEARLNDIFELIENHLKKINKNGLLPAGIILTGGGSNLSTIEEMARVSLKLPAKIGYYRYDKEGLSITGNQKEQILKDPSWSVALGLCAYGLKEESENGINTTRRRAKNMLWRILKSLRI
ncbi:MAG: cell division protein FtsA [Patescibacteria group bacterium]